MMTEAGGGARFLLHGSAEAREAAVELCHLLRDVRGVVEGDDCTEVAIDGALGDLGAKFDALDVRIGEAPPARELTGLEDDVAVFVCVDLVVRPPWVERPADFHGVELIVPRGGAFGSGEHGSTRAALTLLHGIWPADRRSPPGVVVDVGTGSGILALYASIRGAGAVGACDIDVPSVRAARELLPQRSSVVAQGGAEVFAPGCADLVIANLNGRELLESLDPILGLRRQGDPRARCLLSGMKPGDEEAAVRGRLAADAASASVGQRCEVDGYVGLVIGG